MKNQRVEAKSPPTAKHKADNLLKVVKNKKFENFDN